MTIAMHEVGAWVFGLLAILSFKTLVLALPVWAAVRLLRPIRPALEHGIWTAVLAGMLLLPLTSLIGLLPASEQFTLQTEALRLESLGAVGGHSVPDAVRSAQGSWQSWGGLVYLLVLGFFAGRLILGYWRAARLVSRASEIGDEEARGIFDAMIVSLHLTRKVTLLSSSATPTPVTFGCLRPAVILPDTWHEWPSGKLRGVLVHELSHIARRDSWVAVAAAVNCTLFWFHPLSWWLRTRLTSLAERACDDRTVLLTRDREVYAETLLLVASQRRKKDASPAWPAPAMARTSRVTGRIERILSISRPDSGLLGWRALSRLSVAMMAWLLVVGSISPAWARQGATLYGTVSHPSGAGVRNASVFISDAENPQIREVTTARMDGTYSLSGLQSGRQYTIEALSRGFVTFRDIVTVSGDQRFDITLEMVDVTESVQVFATRLGPSSTSRKGERGGNVQTGYLLKEHRVEPMYPPHARRQGVEGTVLIEVRISKDGILLHPKVLNSLVDQRLAEAALKAVRQWRYEPYRVNGEAVEIVTTFTVAFQLGD